jgi:hypothetical protein
LGRVDSLPGKESPSYRVFTKPGQVHVVPMYP